MTSEVVILNKRAVILGADSAVTTSGGDHPRYSKSANKIFELSRNGNVAVAIYGNAAIDSVPWEIVLKMFRHQIGGASMARLNEYSTALCTFVGGNEKLFPSSFRKIQIEKQFDEAVKVVVKDAFDSSPGLCDQSEPPHARQNFWKDEFERLKDLFEKKGVAESLSETELNRVLGDITPWVQRVQLQIEEAPQLSAIDPAQLAELGHRLRYSIPELILTSTGLAVAGYGEEQIFPSCEQMKIYGHVGDELFYKKVDNFEVTHSGIAMIHPLAQSSMIEMFTDGFSPAMEAIIQEKSNLALQSMLTQLAAAGVAISDDLAEEVTQNCHQEFMKSWKRKNWEENFHPLLGVLQSLSVEEMSHLAESLLGLQSLKERVTSPSESVGGPIDVAAITKSEGLVWIRRKHFFDASLNMRYAARLERSFD